MTVKKINIEIFKRGEFENLEEGHLKSKAIVRIHNVADRSWYSDTEKNGIVLFFNDLNKDNLSFIEKIKAKYFPSENLDFFNKSHAEKLLIFIKNNKDKDFIMHCQFARSRSIAVALFMEKHFNGKIINKTADQLEHANKWVIEVLEEVNMK